MDKQEMMTDFQVKQAHELAKLWGFSHFMLNMDGQLVAQMQLYLLDGGLPVVVSYGENVSPQVMVWYGGIGETKGRIYQGEWPESFQKYHLNMSNLPTMTQMRNRLVIFVLEKLRDKIATEIEGLERRNQ